jgi:hypothetical protein
VRVWAAFIWLKSQLLSHSSEHSLRICTDGCTTLCHLSLSKDIFPYTLQNNIHISEVTKFTMDQIIAFIQHPEHTTPIITVLRKPVQQEMFVPINDN